MTDSPVRRFLEAEIRKGIFPGARYRVARGVEVLEDGWVGNSVVEPEQIPVTSETIYDLASLTKPLVTGSLAVLLERHGAIRLDVPLEEYLTEASGRWIGGATLLDLLAHRSGLAAWLPLYLKARNRSEYLREILALPVDYRPGTRVTYSCLGYILVALAMERVCGLRLDELARREIFSPLHLESTCFNPDPSLRPRIAATERGNGREQEIAGEAGRGFHGWRKDVIWGECHDLNAFTLGGVSGNAGLFSVAGDLHAMALEFLGGKARLYDASCLAYFRTDLTARLNENRSVGWQLARTPDCSAGPLLPPGAMGHTGFTGTSLWIDPQEGWILILLTNRVHPRYRPDDMNAVRRRFHRLAIHGE
jgi:CubicO group peptidase (beta-lactamase class C family)